MFWIIAAFIWFWAMSCPKAAFFIVGVLLQICALGSISSLHSGGELLWWFLWCQGCSIFVLVCLIADGLETRAQNRAMGWTHRSRLSNFAFPVYYPPTNYRHPVSTSAKVTTHTSQAVATHAAAYRHGSNSASSSGKSISYINGRFYEVDGSDIRPLNP